MAITRSTVRSPQALGRAMARLRFERGLTQDDLAQALGVSRRYIYEIESGKPNLFSLRLFEVLRELGAHIDVVATEADR
jgi:HTH-type transcriptional regulator/antitoxin HipB